MRFPAFGACHVFEEKPSKNCARSVMISKDVQNGIMTLCTWTKFFQAEGKISFLKSITPVSIWRQKTAFAWFQLIGICEGDAEPGQGQDLEVFAESPEDRRRLTGVADCSK